MSQEMDFTNAALFSVSVDRPETNRRSVFSSIMSALHHSRSLQAQQFLRQNAHLIAHYSHYQTTQDKQNADQ